MYALISDIEKRLRRSSDRRVAQQCFFDAVVTCHDDIARDLYAARTAGFDDSDRCIVIGANDGIGIFLAAFGTIGKDVIDCILATVSPQRSVDDLIFIVRYSVFLENCPIGSDPIMSKIKIFLACYMIDVFAVMFCDHMFDDIHE